MIEQSGKLPKKQAQLLQTSPKLLFGVITLQLCLQILLGQLLKENQLSI